MKGVQEKESSLLIADSDPRDGFFYLPLTPMTDPYIVVHVIITGQSNRTGILYELHITVTYSRANLVALTSECIVKRVICKTWRGTLANTTRETGYRDIGGC